MTELIKPNDKDVFVKENLSDKKFKITFRESFLIIELCDSDDDLMENRFITVENKCKTLYDLKKINGYIFTNLINI